ncbi:hypothetical protein ACPB9E_31715 [Streptomyces exfoliatus]|uniref:hypothetical protein n=1 Tax=Streptomyces exfoliatus TaxID=1905 RepID=UPI003C2D6585
MILDAPMFTGPRGSRLSTAVLRDDTHWDDVVTELAYEHLRRQDLRYLHPDVHKITAAGAALSAHLSTLRGPRSLPSPIVVAR